MMNDLQLHAARAVHNQRLAAALAEHAAHEHPRPRQPGGRRRPHLRRSRSR